MQSLLLLIIIIVSSSVNICMINNNNNNDDYKNKYDIKVSFYIHQNILFYINRYINNIYIKHY